MIVDAIGDVDATLNDDVVVEDITDEFESVTVVEAPIPPVLDGNDGISAEVVPESRGCPGAGDTKVGGVKDDLGVYREGIAGYMESTMAPQVREVLRQILIF
jgi:hypothetical protein